MVFVKYQIITVIQGTPDIITDSGSFQSIQHFRKTFPKAVIVGHSPDGEYSGADADGVKDDAMIMLNEKFPKGVVESVKKAKQQVTKQQVTDEVAPEVQEQKVVEEKPKLTNKTNVKTFTNNGIKFKIENTQLWKLDWVNVKHEDVDMEARALDNDGKVIPKCEIEVKVWTPVEEEPNE